MRPNDIRSLIISRYKAGIKRSLLIEGSPGTGKTEIPEQVAKELGVAFKVIHAPLLQPEDYGFPVISADKKDVDFVVSRDKFPLEDSDCPDEGIFLIDELSQTDNSAQKILANLVQAREIHGHKIKKGWMIVSTGNRAGDRAGAFRLLTHLGNRVSRITMETSLDDWVNWALNNEIKMEVISFLRFRPDLLNHFDAKQDTSPTPRAWSQGVSVTIGAIEPHLEFETFKGDVGEGPAAEFTAYLKICRELPSPDVILMNPKTAEVPKKPAIMYAICAALVNKASKDNFGRVMEYITRLPAEYSVMFVKDTMKRKPDIQNTREFVAWATGPGAK